MDYVDFLKFVIKYNYIDGRFEDKDMDRINPFSNSDFVSYPANYASKQKTALSLAGKDVLKNNEEEINKEISAYLDVLYNQTDEEILSKADKLKLNSAYSPMKMTKLHYGNFFI